MTSKLEELLKESVMEVERRKNALLTECEQIEQSNKQKESEASKRIEKLESDSLNKISKMNKEAELKIIEADKILKSLEGSEEKLKEINDGLISIGEKNEALKLEREEFEKYKVSENQKLDERVKGIELREKNLTEAQNG